MIRESHRHGLALLASVLLTTTIVLLVGVEAAQGRAVLTLA